MINSLYTITGFFAAGGLGFLMHLVLRYWGEDGSISPEVKSKRTLRYVVWSLLLTASGLMMLAPDVITKEALGAAISIGLAGGSVVANVQRISSKKSA